MSSIDLLARVHDFALASLKFYRRLPDSSAAQVPGRQFYRAATGIESNYRAARRGRSRAEFVAKLGTVVEETDEAVGWLTFMKDGQIATDHALLEEARQLRRIFGKSLGTSRRNAKATNRRRSLDL
jgi:four helix bundle protein